MTTKPNAFATMKCKWILLALLFTGFFPLQAQVKYEREYRIRKSQFPESARQLMLPYTEEARRLRFYREVDSNRISYEMKFKRSRLHYSVEFDTEGALEDAEVRIKPEDIPDTSWESIESDLDQRFKNHRIRKIQQQYPRAAFPDDAHTLRSAFQSLLLPEIRYELMVRGRDASGFMDYELQYDASGNFLGLRKSLPPNYDHVLY